MAKVYITSALRTFTESEESCTVSGDTVYEIAENLSRRFPEIRRKFFRDDGSLNTLVIIYLDGKDIRLLQREKTAVNPESEIKLYTALLGG